MSDPAALKARIERAREALRRNPLMFTDKRHPNPGFAKQGRSLRSWVIWSLDHAGEAGKIKACRKIEAAAAKIYEPMFPNPPKEKKV